MLINPDLQTDLSTPIPYSLKDERQQQYTGNQNPLACLSQSQQIPQLRKLKEHQSHNQQLRKNLKNHRTQNSKYLKCKHCQMKFKSNSNRKDHEIRHEQLRKYNCTQCSKRYYRRYLQNDHMQTVHRWSKYEVEVFIPRFKKQKTQRTEKNQQQQRGIFKITKCKKRPQILQRNIHFRESGNLHVNAYIESQEFTENKFFKVQKFSEEDLLPLEAIENVGESLDYDDFQIGKLGDRTPLIFENAFQGIISSEENNLMMASEELIMTQQESIVDLSFNHFFCQLYAFV